MSIHAQQRSLHIAFALYRYFPFGGLQRDMLRIAHACVERGVSVNSTLQKTSQDKDQLEEKVERNSEEYLRHNVGRRKQRRDERNS